MGKYLPVIRVAEYGSLTRAAQSIGCTQPTLGHTVNTIEDELKVKLFYRAQKGMTLTDAGVSLLEIMRQIETLDEKLHQAALLSQGGLIRVGIVPSVASQWLPDILLKFNKLYPNAEVILEHQAFYSEGEIGVKEHTLDCCFFFGKCPAGLASIHLHNDRYFLVVPSDSPLAELDAVSIWDVAGKYPFIPDNESYDPDSSLWNIYRIMVSNNPVECQPHENLMALAMVEKGLGITLLPEMSLRDLVRDRDVKVIPLKEDIHRPVSLLYSKESDRFTLTSAFLELTQKIVRDWEETL